MTQALPTNCSVVNISPLLQQLIIRATEIGVGYARNTPAWRIMTVIRDEVQRLESQPMHLPLPTDSRLVAINNTLHSDPSNDLTLAQWEGKTGMSFGAWRERMRLMYAARSLVEGDSVTKVALDVGYKNTSAFIAMFKRNLDRTPAQYVRTRISSGL